MTENETKENDEMKKQIFTLMPKLMGKVGAVALGRFNDEQRFAFRSYADVYAAVRVHMAELEISMVHEILEHAFEWTQTRSGAPQVHVTAKIRFFFYAPDGSFLTTDIISEAMDTRDKGANKLLSAAMKYALVDTLLIPWHEADRELDEGQHDAAAGAAKPAVQPKPEPPSPAVSSERDAAVAELGKARQRVYEAGVIKDGAAYAAACIAACGRPLNPAKDAVTEIRKVAAHLHVLADSAGKAGE